MATSPEEGISVNLQDLHNSISKRLEDARIPESRLESQLLLRHAFSLTKSDFYMHLYDKDLDASQLAILEMTVQQRIERKPLAYLLGTTEFFGRDFSVNPSVLIPRQETEVLVETCIEILNLSPNHNRIVGDIGTGSGIIAITLAAEIPSLRVIAIDLSPDASETALRNSTHLGTTDSVYCITGDLLTPVRCQFDLIAANLPYIPTANVETLQPEVSIYEPKLALDGGEDGLMLIDRLLNQSRTRINPGGHIVLEIAPPLASPVARLAQDYFPTSQITLLNDLNGDVRIASIQT